MQVSGLCETAYFVMMSVKKPSVPSAGVLNYVHVGFSSKVHQILQNNVWITPVVVHEKKREPSVLLITGKLQSE